MFCLRSWIPILFFLSTNAPPIYLLLFLTVTYFLNRPCVYCSLLLAILVLSLFDFRADWFEPRSSLPHSPFSPSKSSLSSASSCVPGNATQGGDTTGGRTAQDNEVETLSLVVSAVVDTASSLAAAVVEGLKKRTVGEGGNGVAGASTEGLRALWGKREWRVPCLDILLRL
ncbi:hypothetical protein EV356DRAFT_505666 [Viridothelium virens]|uniref:Uncharacterized protein n=1 Tax=Viridothelium virens TaxID=1048519 RepID=A0A6A6H1V7_VIRVR|nr:hypothetical protein EV356DRAFT_505666 [Viridothelium virens]